MIFSFEFYGPREYTYSYPHFIRESPLLIPVSADAKTWGACFGACLACLACALRRSTPSWSAALWSRGLSCKPPTYLQACNSVSLINPSIPQFRHFRDHYCGLRPIPVFLPFVGLPSPWQVGTFQTFHPAMLYGRTLPTSPGPEHPYSYHILPPALCHRIMRLFTTP
jgi:hypothetical protein